MIHLDSLIWQIAMTNSEEMIRYCIDFNKMRSVKNWPILLCIDQVSHSWIYVNRNYLWNLSIFLRGEKKNSLLHPALQQQA